MIRRRDFGLAIGAAAIVGARSNAQAQTKRVFRAANPNAVLDAQQASPPAAGIQSCATTRWKTSTSST